MGGQGSVRDLGFGAWGEEAAEVAGVNKYVRWCSCTGAGAALKSGPDIRDPKPETRNQKLDTHNPQPEDGGVLCAEETSRHLTLKSLTSETRYPEAYRLP